MKKIITMLLAGLMVFGSLGAAFAEESNDTTMESILEEAQDAKTSRLEMQAFREEQKTERFNLIKEFAEKIHQINALRIERNQLQIQVIEKQDLLVDLYIKARESGDNETLKAAMEERQKIKEIRDQIKTFHEQAAEARKAFREAIKNNDKETANEEIDNLIDNHIMINDKIEEKVEILENIIKILS